MKLIREFASKMDKLYVIEELDGFMEEQIRAAGIDCVGKELTGKLYELNPQLLRERIFGQKQETVDVGVAAVSRPPALCPGCPHRGFFYTMSKHICQAQQAALAQGNTLVLYEGYRPHEVQTTVYKALTALSRNDSNIKDAVASAPWNISWFIAGGYSNHQRGFAMDVTLARINRAEIQTIGGHQVLRVREYEEYTMPTPIHELSKAAATYTAPVASHSPTAWKSATMTDTMANCPPALALQRYCTDAGLTPLASEWWHFNDLKTRTSVLDNLSVGGYKISTCLSTAP